jgi:hypothetical protein
VDKAERVEVRDREHELGRVEARQGLVKGARAVQLEEEVPAVDKVEDEVELARGLRASWGGWVGGRVGLGGGRLGASGLVQNANSTRGKASEQAARPPSPAPAAARFK